MKKLKHILYKITNTVNGRYYLGVHSTYKIDDYYMGSGKLLKADIKKYGKDKFTKQVLFIFDEIDHMLHMESQLVTEEVIQDPNSYNIRMGGCGYFGRLMKYQRVSKIPKEQHKNILKGELRTEAQKQASVKHSQRMKNITPWNLGKKCSERSQETKMKISIANKKPKAQVQCPHCNKVGGIGSMHKWHFDKCRQT